MAEMTATDIGTLVAQFWQDARAEWARLATLQQRIDGKLLRTWMPNNADAEYRDLFRKASSPWLGFARDVIAQGCRIDGYSDGETWKNAWQASGMDGRQGAVNREAIGLGYAYGATLPKNDPATVLMRPMSARRTYAVFADPFDEHPIYVLHLVEGDLAVPGKTRWMLLDEEAIYRFNGDPRTPRDVTRVEHGQEHCPVVRIGNTLPVNGRPQSSVEPVVPVYQRIVDATFTLQMLQRYGAFPQKWMAGGEIAVDPITGRAMINASADSLLHASGDSGESARFGTFQAADLNQAVAAVDAHIKHFSALVQVPPHYLLGAVVNMSAEALAAAEAGYFRNIRDRQDALGEGYELWMRDAATMLNLDSGEDFTSEMHWADESTRSISQVADAISKLATDDVDAPLEMLFALIPGWSKTDAIEAATRAEQRQKDRALLTLAAANRPPA